MHTPTNLKQGSPTASFLLKVPENNPSESIDFSVRSQLKTNNGSDTKVDQQKKSTQSRNDKNIDTIQISSLNKLQGIKSETKKTLDLRRGQTQKNVKEIAKNQTQPQKAVKNSDQNVLKKYGKISTSSNIVRNTKNPEFKKTELLQQKQTDPQGFKGSSTMIPKGKESNKDFLGIKSIDNQAIKKILPKQQQILNKTHKGDFAKDKKIDFEQEQYLFLFYASSLILDQQYDQAEDILKNRQKLVQDQQGDDSQIRSKAFRANCKKLLSLCFFKQNKNFDQISKLLLDSKQFFEQTRVQEGQAVCQFALASFYTQKTQSFVTKDFNPEMLMKEALFLEENSSYLFDKRQNKVGQAQSLKLQLTIQKFLNGDSQEQFNDNLSHLKQGTMPEIYETLTSQIQQLEAKQMELTLRQKSNFNPRLQGEDIALIIPICQISSNNSHFNPNSTLKKSEKFQGRKNLTQRKTTTQIESNNQNQVSNFVNMVEDQKVKEIKIDESTIKQIKDPKNAKSQFYVKKQIQSDINVQLQNEQESQQKNKQQKSAQRQNEKQKAFRKSTKEYKSGSSDNEKPKEKKKKKQEDFFNEDNQLISDGYQDSGETSSEHQINDKKLSDKAFLLCSDKKQNVDRRNTVQLTKDQTLHLTDQNKIRNKNFDCFSQNTESIKPNQEIKNFQQIPFDVSSFQSQDFSNRISSFINNLNLNNLPEIVDSKLGQNDIQNFYHNANLSQNSKQNLVRQQMFNQSSIMGISHEDDVRSFDNQSLQSRSDLIKNNLILNKLQDVFTKADNQKQNDLNNDANDLSPQLQPSFDSKFGNLQKQQSMRINDNNFLGLNDSFQTDILKNQDSNNFSETRSVEENYSKFLFNPHKKIQKEIDKISIIGDEIKQDYLFDQTNIFRKPGTFSSGDIPNDSDDPIEVQIVKCIDGPIIKMKNDDDLLPIPIPIPIKNAQSQPVTSADQSTVSQFFNDLPRLIQLEPNPSEKSFKLDQTQENDQQKVQFGNQFKQRVIAEQLTHQYYSNQFFNDQNQQNFESGEEIQNEKKCEELQNNYLFDIQQENIYQLKMIQQQNQNLSQKIQIGNQKNVQIENNICRDSNDFTQQNLKNEHQMQEYQQLVCKQYQIKSSENEFGFINLNGNIEIFPVNQNNEEDILTQFALEKSFLQQTYPFNPVQTQSQAQFQVQENNYQNFQENQNNTLSQNLEEKKHEEKETYNEKIQNEINKEVVSQIRVQGYNEHQISIDENNITDDQKSMITYLYELFNQSESPQQRAFNHQQIIQYLNSEKIQYTIKQHKPQNDKQITQNSRKSLYLSANSRNYIEQKIQYFGGAIGTIKDKVVSFNPFKQMNKLDNSTDFFDDNFNKMNHVVDDFKPTNETAQDNFNINYYPFEQSQSQLEKHYNQQEFMKNYHKQSHEVKSQIRHQLKLRKNEKKNIQKKVLDLIPEEQPEYDSDNQMQDNVILTKSKIKRKSYKINELEDLFPVENQNINDDSEVFRKEALRQIHSNKNKTSRKSRRNLGQQSPKLDSKIFSSGASLKSKKSGKHKKESDQNFILEEPRKGLIKSSLKKKDINSSLSSDDSGSDYDSSVNSQNQSDDSLGVQVSDYKAQVTKKQKKNHKKEAFLKRRINTEEVPLSKMKRRDIEHKDTDEEIEKEVQSKNSEDVAFDSQDSETNNISQSSNTAQPPQVFQNKQNKQSELKLPSRFDSQETAQTDHKSLSPAVDNSQAKKQKDQPFIVVKLRQSVGNISQRNSIHKSSSNQLKQHQKFTGRNSVIEKETKNNQLKKENPQLGIGGSTKSKDSLLNNVFKRVTSIFQSTKPQSSSLSPNAPDQLTEQVSQDKTNLIRELGCNTSRTPARKASIIEKNSKKTSKPSETSPQKKQQILEDRDSQEEPSSSSTIYNKTFEEEKQTKFYGGNNRNVKIIGQNKLLVKQKIEIEIVLCDLTDESSDAIVCPADYLMKMDHGIASQIVAKGGQIILEEAQAELKKKKHFEIGKCLFTQGGNLKARHVIHVVCSAWNKFPQQSDALKKVESCVKNSLNTARKLTDIQIISMPMISVGKGNDEICAQRIIDTCIDWSTQKNTGMLTKIRLCAINDHGFEQFMNWIDIFQIKEIQL